MFNSVTTWFGGAAPPGSAEAAGKTEEDSEPESPDQESKQTDGAVGEKAEDDGTTPEQGADPGQMLEDVSVKAYSTAKAWGSFLYSVSKTATKTVAKTAMQIKDKVEENAPMISDFSKEQKRFMEENREAKRQSEAAVPPWVGYHEETAMKDQILALSLDRRNFLRNPPAGVPFHFDFAALHPIAIATLQEDPNLSKMRFELVPKATSEENFWRNYFYRVSLIKQSTQLTTLAQQTGSTGEVVSSKSSSRRSSEDNGQKGGDSSSSGSDFDKLSDINELSRDAKAENRLEALDAVDSPLGSPAEHEFASDAFQDSTVTEEDIREEMAQMRLSSQEEQPQQPQQQQQQQQNQSSPTDEDIPEWERELQKELQDYDMMDDGAVDDADIESEILKQLEQETALEEKTS